ncbi:MAG TPA: hypothetical protein VMC08_08760 [Bacteroidales bacterium]|nr:hypothetical protein [Bacteroidales bacterium]
MKKIIWYLAWTLSAVAGALMLIAIITSLARTEFLHVKWYTYWWADENFILASILAILLYTQLKDRSREGK